MSAWERGQSLEERRGARGSTGARGGSMGQRASEKSRGPWAARGTIDDDEKGNEWITGGASEQGREREWLRVSGQEKEKAGSWLKSRRS